VYDHEVDVSGRRSYARVVPRLDELQDEPPV
jgi:hypothetical protein